MLWLLILPFAFLLMHIVILQVRVDALVDRVEQLEGKS